MTLADKIRNLIEENDSLTDEQLGQTVDSLLQIHTEEIQEDGLDTYHCHRYEPTPYRVLQVLFDNFPLTRDDVLLDYGSGLGRLAFYTSARFSCPCIGVEMAEKWYTVAENNRLSFIAGDADIRFVLTSADHYEVDDNVTCIYCFNPFSPDVFRHVLSRIERSFERNPRTLTLVLYYPEDDTIFYIEHHTAFHRIDEIAASDAIQKDRRERFSLYRLIPDNQ
ncbi:MAG: class I SAM-dependent methyltransferase [Eubacterium sp.]